MSKKRVQEASSYYPCLRYLQRCGGRAKLSQLNFSRDVIQKLVDSNLAKVANTGAGFYLELEKKSWN
ncbi:MULTISPECIES: hypothetical protein [Nostoc]|uniref:Uncharacterized protein n=1 Tax=Nostoc paludosum FACHB-159 TaxID=2692908 RepID=A0ABR8KLP8_9NOSO|nr:MULTISPECIES: hypothetical protein [Nostoc]MBD2683581.1 hypothetical protein [Nostoc sp. FACHB-857]MBD2739900.1 hypothetical protein [Nostoc paludosum FACHB-159]